MDPLYRNMHSYPNQRDQIHHGPCFYPGAETIPTQMYVNPNRPPINYGCWPWGSNYGYASPTVCHGCCNHTYMPAHYPWGSPYSHVPPPHCPVSYPSFPVQYAPQPCYNTMEQPRYEYEKNVPTGHHCCGCPNHPSHQKEPNNVRIEEEEPDWERRKNDSLVPLQLKNAQPYPIVWSPDYSNKKEQEKSDNSGFWKDGAKNGWYPLDLNKLVSSKQRGEEERNRQQDDDDDGDERGRFPFPLFWIPYKPEGKEMEKTKSNDSDGKPRLESEKGSGGEKKFHVIGEDIGKQAASKAISLPLMKEVEKHDENGSSKNHEKEREASVKDRIDSGEEKLDNGERKFAKESVKGKSPSPPKSSKLPPVCLRVDPLPRKKNANGRSRSLSPPGDKQKRDLWPNEANKVLKSSEDSKLDKIPADEFKESKGTKTIEVVDGKTWQRKNVDVNMETPVILPVKSKDDFSTNQPEEKPKEENVPRECTGTDAVKSQPEEAAMEKNEEGTVDMAKETSKRELSEEEAAVIIQSAYRGFEVRRWESIKKLKEIAKVQEQIANVKHMIQAIESSSDIQGSSKQRNIISETIMSLLLKLDTIQGLHPSIREVRKSVVKELVSLQEKLDSLMPEKSGRSPEQDSILRCAEDSLDKIKDVTLSQNGNETPSDSSEAAPNQFDGAFKNGNLEISEAKLNVEEARETQEKEAEVNENEMSIKTEDEINNEVLENEEKLTAEDNHEDLVQSTELSELRNSSDKLDSDLAELPQGVLDDLYAQESTNHKTVDSDTTEACQEKQLEEGQVEAPITSELHDDATGKENKEHVEEIHDVLDLLPVSGVNVDSDKVDIKTEDDKFEPEECVDQQSQNVVADIIEPSEASGNRELPTAEVCNEFDTLPEKEMSNQLIHEGNLEQEIGLVNESAKTHEAEDLIGVKDMAENKSDHGEIHEAFKDGNGDEEITVQDMKDKIMSDEAKDDLTESNRKLIEENERLRDIMEKLIKSGQEQLTAISSLSGRVKDLEKKLSKKKKLKVKKNKSNKMKTLVPDDE
ncbi:hypothetical protein DH2020_023108 [Rehmannia glutinosa]|uniref:BAG domain-containing protein n=1 Tax=Rehmannia glutinosa TaxID=99300 RepID=A0ABR0W6J2_REHGL